MKDFVEIYPEKKPGTWGSDKNRGKRTISDAPSHFDNPAAKYAQGGGLPTVSKADWKPKI